MAETTNRCFTDGKNRKWTVHVDVNAIRRARQLAGVDLMRIADSERDENNLVYKLMTDPVLTVETLYAVIQPALETANVTPEDFGAAIDSGDIFQAAHDALLEATIDFFPSQKRKSLHAVLAKIRKAESRMEQMAEQVLAEGGQLDQLIEAEFAKVLLPGGLSSSSPASAE